MLGDKLPRALPRDVPDYHAREAAHWRALAATETAAPVKSTLLSVAERHERLAAPNFVIPIHCETPSAKAGRLRRCAARARRLAERTHAKELYGKLVGLAIDYETMARRYEVQAAHG
jgi:hypothetical protein